MHPTSRLLIMEPIGDIRATPEFNLAMLVMYGGRERRLEEFRTLTASHRLTMDTVVDLTDQRCLLEFRPTDDR